LRYSVHYSKNALKQLKKLDNASKILIINWVDKNLEGCEDPRVHGKRLSGNLKYAWRYRVGNYRLIADIIDGTVVIHILEIGHRNKVYG
jgi:mRNA interferase RelE/StbE